MLTLPVFINAWTKVQDSRARRPLKILCTLYIYKPMAELKIKAQVRGGHLKNWSDESIIGMSLPPNAEEALVKKKKKYI